jgi:uncharacterized protein YyaL (SSP411 family)
MARDLFLLGHLLDEERYRSISTQMLNNVKDQMSSYPQGFSNWAQLMIGHVFIFHEIAITGPACEDKRAEFGTHYLPNRMFLGGRTRARCLCWKGKLLDNSTTIFVCENKVCKLPVADGGRSVEAAAMRRLGSSQ